MNPQKKIEQLFEQKDFSKLSTDLMSIFIGDLKACSASYYSKDIKHDYLILRYRFPYSEWAQNNVDDFTVNLDFGLAGRAAATQKIIFEEDVKNLSPVSYINLNDETISEIAIPIFIEDTVIGVICIDWNYKVELNDPVIEYCKTFQNVLNKKEHAIILQNVHLVRQLLYEQKMAARQINFLQNIGNVQCFSRHEVYNLLTKNISECFDVFCCTYDVYNYFENTLTFKSIYPSNLFNLIEKAIFNVNDSVVGKAIIESKIIITPLPSKKLKFNNTRLIKENRIDRIYSIPIERPVAVDSESDKQKIGIINIYIGNKNKHLNESLLNFIQQICQNKITQTILNENQNLIERLKLNYLNSTPSNRDIRHKLHTFNLCIVDLVKDCLLVEGVSVLIKNSHSMTFSISATSGIENAEELNEPEYVPGLGITGVVLESGKTIVSQDISKDLRYRGISKEVTIHPGKSFIGTPLKDHYGNVIGCIRCTNKITNPVTSNQIDFFSQDDKDLIEFIANWAQSFIEIIMSDQFLFEITRKNIHESNSQLGGIGTKAESIQKLFKGIPNTKEFTDNEKSKILKYFKVPKTLKYLKDIINHSKYLRSQLTVPVNSFNEHNIELSESRLWGDIIIPTIKDSLFLCEAANLDHNKIIYPPPNIYQSLEPIWVDREKFKQVFSNLISNAIKYSFEDKSSFSIRISQEILETEVLIRVEDYGIGISESYKSDIFLKGFRTPEAKKKTIQGLGLGLHIIKSILDAHGCQIILERNSFPTAFCIKIPNDLKRNWKQI